MARAPDSNSGSCVGSIPTYASLDTFTRLGIETFAADLVSGKDTMTDSDLTLLAFLVDHSGSMRQGREDMEGGINTLIEEQAKQPGKCEVAIAQFDSFDSFDLVIWPPVNIKEAPKYALIPAGMTALHDAAGKFITTVGTELRKRTEATRPGKVIFVIVTDGLENNSREWDKAKVKALIEEQKSQWSWEFLFLGANMDAVAEGGGIGIRSASAMTYNQASKSAIHNTYAASSANISDYRSGVVQSVDFSEGQRLAAMVEDEPTSS